MAHLALGSFDAHLDSEHGGAMVVFRVDPSDVPALRAEIAYGEGTVVYEHGLGARRLT